MPHPPHLVHRGDGLPALQQVAPTDAPAGHDPRRRSAWRLLLPASLLLCALAIRLWGVSFGLPYFFSGDEIAKRRAAVSLAERGFVHRTSQPSFLYNSLYLLYAVPRWAGVDLSTVEQHLAGRIWIVVLGSLTVLATWRLGLFWGRDVGLLAALFLAVVPIHTAASRYIKEDAPLALMTTIALTLMVAHLERPSRARLAAAAFFTGVAFSTKYSGLLLAPALAAAFGATAWRDRARPRRVFVDGIVLLAAVPAGFFVVSPIYLLHPHTLLQGVLGQWNYASTGHRDGIALAPWSEGWLYYAREGLGPGLTWPLFLAGLAGLATLLGTRNGWLVTASAAWLYLVFEHGRAKPYPFAARYVLPLAPLLCVSAAHALGRLAGACRRRFGKKVAAGAPALAAALLLAWPLALSALVADEALHDTRLAAGAWMTKEIPAGARVILTEPARQALAARDGVKRWKVLLARSEARLGSALAMDRPCYVVVTSFAYQRYLDRPEARPSRTRFYEEMAGSLDLVKEFRPRWLTYGHHSPVVRIYAPPGSSEALPGR